MTSVPGDQVVVHQAIRKQKGGIDVLEQPSLDSRVEDQAMKARTHKQGKPRDKISNSITHLSQSPSRRYDGRSH